nr:hypothetical protein [Actinomycetales bacterium]
RFPHGAPSLRAAHLLAVEGDYTFGRSVRVVGEVRLPGDDGARLIADGAVLRGPGVDGVVERGEVPAVDAELDGLVGVTDGEPDGTAAG